MPQATLIYNPLAGPTDLTKPIADVANLWRSHGWDVALQATRFGGHAMTLAAAAAQAGHRLVLAAGGDGTLGEVVNGLAGSETALGVLPAGTANSFAQELHIPRPNYVNRTRLLQAAKGLLNGRIQAMDLGYTHMGEGHGRYWLLWSSTGGDSYLVDKIEPRPKWSKKLGRLGYVLQGVSILPDAPRMQAEVVIDGRSYAGDYLAIIISNCRRYVGGMVELSPHAQLDDGVLEVWLVGGRSPLGHGSLAIADALVQIKLQHHLDHPQMTCVTGKQMTIHTQPIMPCQTDGEPAGHTPLRCEVRAGALQLLVPQATPANLFCQPERPL